MRQPVNVDQDVHLMVLFPLQEPLQTMHGSSAVVTVLLQLGLYVEPKTQDGKVGRLFD